MPLLKRFRKLFGDERGNALAIGAATMPLLIASAGLAVDTVSLSFSKRQLQRAADSAALAGAHALSQEKTVATSVSHDLAFNNDIPLTGSPIIQVGPFGAYTQSVRVSLSADRKVSFLSLFMNSTTRVNAEARAAIVVTGPVCMTALEDGNAPGITFSGSTDVDLGCGVASNSTANNAIQPSGTGATVRASPLIAVGGIPASSIYQQPMSIIPYGPRQKDPFAHLPDPSVNNSECNKTPKVNPNGSMELEPGCYNGITINGPATLAPGVYYINGGTGNNPNSLNLGAQANLTGTGVTIILTNSNPSRPPATISMNGGAVMDLSAPKSGTYEGVLFYQDRRAPLTNNSVTINGNSASNIEGAFYFPQANLTYNGNTGVRTRCMQMVGRRLTFSGNSRIENVCPDDGGAKAFDATQVKLIA